MDGSRKRADQKVKGWLEKLKSSGGFGVEPQLLKAAKADFESERVPDKEHLRLYKRSIQLRRLLLAKISPTEPQELPRTEDTFCIPILLSASRRPTTPLSERLLTPTIFR